MPTLHLVIGPPGAGKTTWARAAFQAIYHPNYEHLIQAITPDGLVHFHSRYRVVADQVFLVLIAELLCRQQDLVLTDWGGTRDRRALWIARGHDAGYAVRCYRLMTDVETCIQRARSDLQRPKTSRQHWPKIVRHWFAVYEPVNVAIEGLASYAEIADAA